jgi:hypothetical protein
MRRELGRGVAFGAIGYGVQAARRTRPVSTTPPGGPPLGEVDVVKVAKAG